MIPTGYYEIRNPVFPRQEGTRVIIPKEGTENKKRKLNPSSVNPWN